MMSCHLVQRGILEQEEKVDTKKKKFHPNDIGDLLNLVTSPPSPPPKRGLVRSMSHDSFSTITTAAETAGSSTKRMSIIWDGHLPVEVSIPSPTLTKRKNIIAARATQTPLFQKPRHIPDPSLGEDDEESSYQQKSAHYKAHQNEESRTAVTTTTSSTTNNTKPPLHPTTNEEKKIALETVEMEPAKNRQCSKPRRRRPPLTRTPSGGMDYLRSLPQRFTRFEI